MEGTTAELIALRTLLSMGSFRVPDFQRSFCWTGAQVKQFLADLVEAHTSNVIHPLGTVSCAWEMDGKGGRWIIIDGQQRLTCILMLLNLLNPDGSWRGLLQLQEAADGPFKVLTSDNRMPANQQLLLELGQDGLSTEAAARLLQCYITQRKWASDQSVLPAVLVSTLLDRFQVIVLRMQNTDGAHRLFEVTNSRGLPLTTLDRLKNLLLLRSLSLHKESPGQAVSAAAAVKDAWEEFHLWFARYGLGRPEEKLLVRALVSAKSYYVEHHGGIYDQLKELFLSSDHSSLADIYSFLSLFRRVLYATLMASCPQRAPPFIPADTRLQLKRELVHEMQETESVLHRFNFIGGYQLVEFYCFVLYAKLDWDDETSAHAPVTEENIRSLIHVLGHAERYWFLDGHVAQLNVFVPGSSEMRMSRHECSQSMIKFLARHVQTEESALRKFLSSNPCILKDRFDLQWAEENQRDFSQWSGIRHLLVSYERWSQPKFVTDHEHWQVEHIMPQKWPTHWADALPGWTTEPLVAGGYAYHPFVGRLGNLCLLERSVNVSVSNSDWAQKTRAYDDSKIVTTMSITADEWDFPVIIKREQALIEFCCEFWFAKNRWNQQDHWTVAQGDLSEAARSGISIIRPMLEEMQPDEIAKIIKTALAPDWPGSDIMCLKYLLRVKWEIPSSPSSDPPYKDTWRKNGLDSNVGKAVTILLDRIFSDCPDEAKRIVSAFLNGGRHV